jgi:sugar transferase (PEP-CTERM/EpsH1 system associated)
VARILFLPHRMPFPPDKGDKIRSYHLLRHLAARHEVTLATFIDDPADEAHVGAVRALCHEAHFERLRPRLSRLRSLRALLTGEAMTLHYYRHAGMARFVRESAAGRMFDAAVVFSSSMAQYAEALPGTPTLLDLVDVDSAKWAAYAPRHTWPLSWPLTREGRKLLAYEQRAVAAAHGSFLCTEQERELFHSISPQSKGRVQVLRNGVDATFYSPEAKRRSPFAAGVVPLVFTGAMDYWPNVDGVSWFAQSMLPALRQRHPALHFYIVGRNPSAAVQALAGETITVTGTVPDVRPYLQHAAVVVAPLRIARGIQNKILEAMAMARPVIAAASCGAALDARRGQEYLAADTEADYIAGVDVLLADPARAAHIGAAGRRRVLDAYSWDSNLAVLDTQLQAALERRAAGPAGPAGPAVPAPSAAPAAMGGLTGVPTP